MKYSKAENPHASSTPSNLRLLIIFLTNVIFVCMCSKDNPPAQVVDKSSEGRSLSPVLDTVFLIRTYSDFTHWKLAQIERYVLQLRPLGIPVAVLRDVSFLSEVKSKGVHPYYMREAVSVSDMTIEPSLLQLIGDVPLCDVTWTAVKEEFTLINFDEYSQLGGTNTKVVKKGGVHNPFELLWWRQCRSMLPIKDVKHVWMAEDDAFFVGHLERFIRAYANDSETDLIAAGFRIAGKDWWNFKNARSTFPDRMLKFTTQDSGLITNVQKLPTLHDGACSARARGDVGVIFRQDVVERVSSRLFEKLEELINSGIIGPGEAFLSTICGSERWCTMHDFAPVFERRTGKTFASPQYCWHGVGEQRFQCRSEFQEKWIHPVKTKGRDWILNDCYHFDRHLDILGM